MPDPGTPTSNSIAFTNLIHSVKSSFTFPAGVAVKSTSVLCARLINTTQGGNVFLSATAHGYFAPDR